MKNAQANFDRVSVFNVPQMASRWQYRDDHSRKTLNTKPKNIFVVSLQTNDWQVINKIKNLFVREYERKAKYMIGSKIKQNGCLYI